MPKSKNYLVTISSDAYFPGTLALFHSLAKNFSALSKFTPLVMYHSGNAGGDLSEENQAKLKQLLPTTIFKELTHSIYRTVDARLAEKLKLPFLEAITTDDADRILWMDSDMLCVQDFSEIMNISQDWISCWSSNSELPDEKRVLPRDRWYNANFGLVLINRPEIFRSQKEKFIQGMLRTRGIRRDSFFNSMFRSFKDVADRPSQYVLPRDYERQLTYMARGTPHKTTKNIHFAGTIFKYKPWEKNFSRRLDCQKIWSQYHDEVTTPVSV